MAADGTAAVQAGGTDPSGGVGMGSAIVGRKGRRGRASSSRGTVQADGFRSTAGNPQEAMEYQQPAVSSGYAVGGGFGGSQWGAEPAGSGPVAGGADGTGVASAGVMDSGLPGASDAGGAGAVASEADLQLLQQLGQVVGQLREAVQGAGDQKVCDDCMASVGQVQTQWQSGQLSAGVADGVRAIAQPAVAYDFGSALKAHSALGRSHWGAVKGWSGGLKGFLRLANKMTKQ